MATEVSARNRRRSGPPSYSYVHIRQLQRANRQRKQNRNSPQTILTNNAAKKARADSGEADDERSNRSELYVAREQLEESAEETADKSEGEGFSSTRAKSPSESQMSQAREFYGGANNSGAFCHSIYPPRFSPYGPMIMMVPPPPPMHMSMQHDNKMMGQLMRPPMGNCGPLPPDAGPRQPAPFAAYPPPPPFVRFGPPPLGALSNADPYGWEISRLCAEHRIKTALGMMQNQPAPAPRCQLMQ